MERIDKYNSCLIPVLILITIFFGISLYVQKHHPEIITKTEDFLLLAEEKVTKNTSIDIINYPEKEDTKNEITTSAWIAYWDENRGIKTAIEQKDLLESVSPTWYYLKDNGSIEPRTKSNYKDITSKLHDNNIHVLPTIAHFSSESLSNILNNKQIFESHISKVIEIVLTNNFDGIDIDYEQINQSDKDKFSQFINKLGEELHKNNKELTIAVLAKTDNFIYKLSETRQAQDWENIGESVDEFRIMCYDWTHNSTTNPGAIAPSSWIREIINFAIDKVDRKKIVIGLPLYGYKWSGQHVSAITYDDIDDIIKNGYSQKWDDSSEENYLYLNEENQVWYQNVESIELKRKIAKDTGIKGVIYWRLGGEDPKIWDIY